MTNLIIKNLFLIVLSGGIAYVSRDLPLRIYLFLSGGCAIPIDTIGLREDYNWPFCSRLLTDQYWITIQIFSAVIFFIIYYLIFRIVLERLIKW